MDDAIEVVSADPAWPERFQQEAAALHERLAMPGLTIEHFGSTAVPGLDTKPIIDILLLPPPDYDWQALNAPLESLGYRLEHRPADGHRLMFVKRTQGRRSHHLHVMDLGDAERHLLFRDWLRQHPDDARRYQQVKHRAAARHREDREAYTDDKDAIVQDILARAMTTSQQQAPIQGGDEGGPVEV